MNHTDEQAPAITLQQLLVTTPLQLSAALQHAVCSVVCPVHVRIVRCLVFLTIPHYIGPWLLATNVQDQ